MTDNWPPPTPPPAASLGVDPRWPAPTARVHLDDEGVGTVSMSSSATGSSWPMRLALVAATALVGAGAFWAISRALNEPAGPATPEDAVERLFAALDNEDLLSAAEVLEPGERESLVEPMRSIVGEFQRLEVVDTDLSAVQGLEIEVVGLALTSEPVAEGLVKVTTTGGTVTVAGGAGLPFDQELLGDINSGGAEREVVDLVVDPAEMIVVERDGSWYVSVFYSIAEDARANEGGAPPVLGAGPAPVGASTPVEAFTGMLENLVDLDAEGVLTMLDPVEAAVLYDYSYLFLDDLDRGAADLRSMADSEGIAWGIDRIDAVSSDLNGRKIVTVESMAAHVEVGPGGERFSFVVEQDCLSYDLGDLGSDQLCNEELANELEGEMGANPFGDAGVLTSGVTVVARDGRWFVSVAPSALYLYRDMLVEMERDDIENLAAMMEQILAGGSLPGTGFGS